MGQRRMHSSITCTGRGTGRVDFGLRVGRVSLAVAAAAAAAATAAAARADSRQRPEEAALPSAQGTTQRAARGSGWIPPSSVWWRVMVSTRWAATTTRPPAVASARLASSVACDVEVVTVAHMASSSAHTAAGTSTLIQPSVLRWDAACAFVAVMAGREAPFVCYGVGATCTERSCGRPCSVLGGV
jgi:hypothetical protein